MLCHRECKTKNAYGLVVLILDDEILNVPSYVHHTIPKAGAHILSKLRFQFRQSIIFFVQKYCKKDIPL